MAQLDSVLWPSGSEQREARSYGNGARRRVGGLGYVDPRIISRGPYSTFRVKIIVTSDEPAEAIAAALLEWVER